MTYFIKIELNGKVFSVTHNGKTYQARENGRVFKEDGDFEITREAVYNKVVGQYKVWN
jgi:hypothetical protein